MTRNDVPELEAALSLTTRQGGGRLAQADPRYEAMNGMLGGWTAAVLLRAGLESAGGELTPAALTVNFVAKVEAQQTVLLQEHRLGAGRSLEHWRVAAVDPESGRVLADALLVLASRRSTDGRTQPSPPEAPLPSSLDEWRPNLGSFGRLLQIRPVRGYPPYGSKDTSSLAWLREATGRPVDHLQLALLADCLPPRPLYWSDGPRACATLSLSVYFLATATELAAVGDDYVLAEAIGTRGADSVAGQAARLWSASGTLLATTEQLCWYR